MKKDELSKLDFGEWPLPTEYLTELGRITALWGFLEVVLNLSVAKFAGLNFGDARAEILFSHLSLPQRLDILASLVKELDNPSAHIKEVSSAISKIKSAQKLRNKVSHSGSYYDDKTGKIKIPSASARGRLKLEVELYSLEDYKRVVVAIDDASRSLYFATTGQSIDPGWLNNLRKNDDA